MPRLPTEKELLEGLDEYSAHADELAIPSDDEWFDDEGVSEDFMKDRDSPGSQER